MQTHRHNRRAVNTGANMYIIFTYTRISADAYTQTHKRRQKYRCFIMRYIFICEEEIRSLSANRRSERGKILTFET